LKESSTDPARFAASPIGDLLPISGTDGRGQTYERVAFAAHPLAAPPELCTATWNRVAFPGLTYQAVSNAVRKLEEVGILEQRNVPGVMVFRAPDVVAIISAPSAA